MSTPTNTGQEEAEGDNTEITCPCGSTTYFESADGEPREGTEIDCDCGRKLVVETVDWSAYVCARVERR